jgi:O-antigen ligase
MLVLSIFSITNFYFEKKLIFFIIFLVFSVICIISLGRMSIAALFISISMFYFFISKKKIFSVLISVAISTVIIFIFTAVDTIKERTFHRPEEVTFQSFILSPKSQFNNISSTGRDFLWSLSLDKFFWKNPWIGSGVGSTQAFFYDGIVERGKGAVHSEYVRILCELGIIGCFLFILAFLSYLFRMYKIFKLAKYDCTKKFALTAILSLGSFFLLCITGNMIDYIFPYSMYMFAFVGFSLRTFELERMDLNDI